MFFHAINKVFFKYKWETYFLSNLFLYRKDENFDEMLQVMVEACNKNFFFGHLFYWNLFSSFSQITDLSDKEMFIIVEPN